MNIYIYYWRVNDTLGLLRLNDMKSRHRGVGVAASRGVAVAVCRRVVVTISRGVEVAITPENINQTRRRLGLETCRSGDYPPSGLYDQSFGLIHLHKASVLTL